MKQSLPSTGYLILNLGTPRSPTTRDVRRYLHEFLMDPYVIDLPWILRKILVAGFILPFRPKRSAAAYAKIWTNQGSPLAIHSQALQAELSKELEAPVAVAMRYGEPTIELALSQLKTAGVTDVVVAPLYPQYADSTVKTSLEAVGRHNPGFELHTLQPFYARDEFILPLAEQITPCLQTADHVLFSFHGLPEAHLERSDPGSHCLANENCCDIPSAAHATCYRHQCFATVSALAQKLTLNEQQYSVSFQSRLGRQPWLQPYTDQLLAQLPDRGIKRLAVACPSFVADNLETLEEMGMQGRQIFMQAGGEHFELVPCLNQQPQWVSGLANLLRHHTVAASSLTSS